MKLVWGLLILAAIMGGSILIWLRFGEQNPASVMGPLIPAVTAKPEGSVLALFGQAPDFLLTERSGGTFSKEKLAGKPWVADFIFTSCAGQCPLMSLEMKKLQNQFGAETGFRFVSFSVDPDRDTPAVLAEYANRYEAQKDRWFFLTGPRQEINRILKEFFLSPVEEPAMHSIRFILVDGKGQIRGYYDASDTASMDQLVHDAKLLTTSK